MIYGLNSLIEIKYLTRSKLPDSHALYNKVLWIISFEMAFFVINTLSIFRKSIRYLTSFWFPDKHAEYKSVS